MLKTDRKYFLQWCHEITRNDMKPREIKTWAKRILKMRKVTDDEKWKKNTHKKKLTKLIKVNSSSMGMFQGLQKVFSRRGTGEKNFYHSLWTLWGLNFPWKAFKKVYFWYSQHIEAKSALKLLLHFSFGYRLTLLLD